MSETFQTTPSDADAAPTAKRILLADDDAALRRLLEVVLNRAGYEVLTAEDGLDAMQKAASGDFDVLVADAMMPNLSGYELCRIFRSHPNWQQIPLVMLSGLDDETNVEVDAHVVKTSRLQEELLSVLARLLAPAA